MMLVIPRLIYLILFLSFVAHAEQGTMTTDDNSTSQAEASLSGTEEEHEMDLRVEEVQLQEEPLEQEPEDRNFLPDTFEEPQ
jgi:hypothetical protein